MKVFCRFAPNGQAADKSKFNIEVEGTDTSMPTTLTLNDHTTGAALSVGCNAVFGPKEGQRTVYNAIGLPLIEKALQGESCAMLAYGQTASGKTHSMLGPQGADPRHLLSEHPRYRAPTD
jgi:hypothetical protein